MKKKWIWLTLLVNVLLCFTASIFYLWHYTGWSLQKNILLVVAGCLATLYPENVLWVVYLFHSGAICFLIYLVLMSKWKKASFATLHIVMVTHWFWPIYCAKLISKW